MILQRLMKPSVLFAMIVACFCLSLPLAMTATTPGSGKPAQAADGGEITIRSSAITAGGGTSSGGEFSATSTSGQPAVGVMSGGGFTATGGFSPTPAPPAAPSADPTGIDKCKFVSFVMPIAGDETAIRIWLVSLHHVVPPYTGGPSVPFSGFEGQVRWVGAPMEFVESSAGGTPFYASLLQCDPHYQDWSTVGLLHVTGSAFAPSSMFEVETVAASCMGSEANCLTVSARLSIRTTRWGDVEGPYNPPDASAQPDLGDVSALANKFRGIPDAPIKARALLAGDDAFGNVSAATMSLDFSFAHIAACVDAFRGKPYPYAMQSCP